MQELRAGQDFMCLAVQRNGFALEYAAVASAVSCYKKVDMICELGSRTTMEGN